MMDVPFCSVKEKSIALKGKDGTWVREKVEEVEESVELAQLLLVHRTSPQICSKLLSKNFFSRKMDRLE